MFVSPRRSNPTIASEAIALTRRWRAAAGPRREVPLYEDLVLGELGPMAERCGVLARKAEGWAFMFAGERIEAWIGRTVRSTLLDELPTHARRAIAEAADRALATGTPAAGVANRILDGSVLTVDLTVLPLASRWSSEPWVLVHAAPRRETISLVEAIVRATDDALIGLSALRGADGAVFDFQIVTANEGAARLLGRSRESLAFGRLGEAVEPLAPDIVSRLAGVLESGERISFEIDLPLTGRIVPVRVNAAAFGDLLSLGITDISVFRDREARFRLLYEDNPAPVWVYDVETLRFLEVNRAACDLYGYDRDTFLGLTVLDIRPQSERARAAEIARTVCGSYAASEPFRHLRADGSEIAVLSYARSIEMGGSRAVVVLGVDVTERERAEAKIAHMALHDALTDLPNRVLFRERVDEALSRLRRAGDGVAVLCLDLDHFKAVNDTLGHPVGDKLLTQVAARLTANVREADMVARLSGDEFAIVARDACAPQALDALAQRLVAALDEPFEIDGHQVVIGLSIGIAIAPADGADADTLIKNADIALYRAKAEGRRGYRFFEASMDARLQARRLLELDLREAVRRGELVLHYQPQMDTEHDRITGFEALLRWQHPTRGLVPPADFIPVAEETGLIVPIGEWVVRRACADATAWREPYRVAVNLSPAQFKSKALVASIVHALADTRLPAQRLELEITESVLLAETEGNLATLHALKQLGVKISLDDFGTGYSSLSYLRSFPFDKIKIDRSFVRELSEREDSAAIIRAIAGLGQSLGMATMAEGVETREQLERLRTLGLTEVQGYLLSPPRPADAFPEIAPRITSAERDAADAA
ncbi:putative bifunctional diguanylate cyclase/phosphodiesterase [Salinarimonas ramus]|uniref:GGDEF domain-containing protein n=1 Tax=Salinarimonas ramus TaxID=690164 RepID=A0A917Q2W3_9HYPH|nr:EAL domain-containing protein [Salinarimonas ramus]GGK17598.1 GGDEF domain-containing protein [Salinarimonas ramus]